MTTEIVGTHKTAVRECVCDHPYQNTRYGRSMRLMNPLAKKSKGDVQKYRCTVCGRIHE